MLIALQRETANYHLDLSDLFLMSGFDHRGTVHSRHLPAATVIKTGTLNNVSTLAGVLPTRDRGLVWFAIFNQGNNVSGFRAEQDNLIQHLAQQLHPSEGIPPELMPHSAKNSLPLLGAANRNQILYPG
jgi:D-alanyl-D-alanine carboxypeptidase/D-alanyl-D-alanine-endopeptidase (penicillin-binding protein 4)